MVKKNFLSLTLFLTLFLVIITAPINLFYKLPLGDPYVRGFFIDYLVPKFYLYDIFMLSFILVGGIYLINKHQEKLKSKIQNFRLNTQHLVPLHLVYLIFIGLSIFFIIRQFFTANSVASVYWLIKLTEAGLFGLVLFKLIKLTKRRYQALTIFHHRLSFIGLIKLALAFAVIFQTTLGLYQFHFQRNLLSYQYLGETNLSQPVGLAKVSLCHQEKVLAYGTTAHPNILAGVVLFYSLLLFALFRHKKTTKSKKTNGYLNLTVYGLIFIAPLITIGITLSFSAFLGFIFGLFGLIASLYKPKLTKLVLAVGLITFFLMPVLIQLANTQAPGHFSLSRRAMLNQAAIKMWQAFPLTGVGLNNFTVYVEQFSQSNEVVRFPQPAHHVGLLFLAENGALGIVIVAVLIILNQLRTKSLRSKAKNSSKITLNQRPMFDPKLFIIVLLPLASLDHWLITQPVGLVILTLVVSTKAILKRNSQF